MDFLEIRKKARQRAEARAQAAGAPAATRPPPPPASGLPTPAPGGEGAPPLPPALLPLEDPAPARNVAVPRGEPSPAAPDVPAPRASPAPEPFPDEDPPDRGAPAPVWSPSLLPPEPRRPALAAAPPPPPPAPAEAPSLLPLDPVAPAAPPAAPPADALSDFFFDPDEVAPAVPDLGLCEPARDAAREGPEQRREYLAFRLGEEEYAFAIDFIREILKAPPITEVPRAPAHVLGVITVRGEVIPIFDPRRRLGLPAPQVRGPGRVIVCDAGEGPCGLLVDSVAQVVRLPPSAIEQKPQGIVGSSAEYIAGIGRDRERLYILLDLAAVLRFGSKPKEALAT